MADACAPDVPLAHTDAIPMKFRTMPHRLRELGPQHHTAIRMRLEGVSTQQIAETLDVQKRTVYLWFSDPLVKAELGVRLEQINEMFAEKLASAAVSALTELKAM